MIAATKHQDGFKLGVTAREIEEARQAAQEALDRFAQPEEVQTGQWLCCRGRVTRAVTIAGTRPEAEWPKLREAITKLAAIADQRYQQWLAAERHYRELCRQAGKEMALSQGETCTCEGCQIEAENIASVQNPQDHRLPLPKHLHQKFKDFAEARTVQASYRHQYRTAIAFDQATGDYILKDNGQSA